MSDHSLTACAGKAHGCGMFVVVAHVVCSDCETSAPSELLRRLVATQQRGPRPEKLAIRAAIREHLAVPA